MSGERRRLIDMLSWGFCLGVGFVATTENISADSARSPHPWGTIGLILIQVVAWTYVIRRLMKAPK
jgi:hypothetical protein